MEIETFNQLAALGVRLGAILHYHPLITKERFLALLDEMGEEVEELKKLVQNGHFQQKVKS